MDFLLEALTNWLKEMLVGGIMSNLSGMFDSVNQQVADISVQVGQTPQGWNGSIFSMIENLSNSIMVPIAGVILAIVMTVDLIQMIADKNNLHDVDTWMIFKWVFKSAAAILIVTNTWNIVMGVFDMAQSVVAQAAGIINSDASIDISSVMTDLEPRLMEMDLGPLFGLWFQSLFIGITMWALYICIFIVIYGRMIEIYLVTSVAPVPMAAMMGKEWGGTQKQAELNSLYDSFSAKCGLINDRANRLAYADDSSYYLLCALEVIDEDGKLERKADMFTKRTIKPHQAVATVDTASEALAVSISEKACVDMSYMSRLTGKTKEELA